MKRRLGSFLIVLIVIALVIYVLRDINFGEVWRLIGEVDLRLFFLAIIVFGLSFLVWNFRWRNSLKGLQDVKYWELIRYLFVGVFFNTITPGTAVGGEPVRAYLLGKRFDKPKSKFFGVILGDQSFHLMGFVFYFIFTLIFIVFFLKVGWSYKVFFGIILGVILVLIGGFVYIVFNKFSGKGKWIPNFLYLFKPVKKRFRSKQKLKDYLVQSFENVGERFRWVVKDKRKLFIGILSSIIFQLCIFTASYILFLSLDYRINFLYVVVALSVGYFFGDLSPSPGGIGIFEVVVLVIYTALGVNPELALSVALLDRVISLFYRIGLGGFATLSFSERVKNIWRFSYNSEEIDEEFPK
jgi:glycosyltransferase 2 family protein